MLTLDVYLHDKSLNTIKPMKVCVSCYYDDNHVERTNCPNITQECWRCKTGNQSEAFLENDPRNHGKPILKILSDTVWIMKLGRESCPKSLYYL